MDEDLQISELKVLSSAAGYYIGRTCVEDGLQMPYDRQSEYYPSRKAAQEALDTNNYWPRSNP